MLTKSIARAVRAAPMEAERQSISASLGSLPTTECGACGRANSVDRRFCADCGQSLWRKCLQCAEECSVGEAFCGRCGANQTELLATKLAEIDGAIQLARGRQEAKDYLQAILMLRSIRDHEHPSLAARITVARQLAKQWTDERAEWTQLAEAAEQTAEQATEKCRFKEAIVAMQPIPAAFRTPRGQQLLEAAEARYREIRQLRTEIAADVEARHLLQLAPKIDRYLSLQPGDEKITVLAGKVRDHACAKVREAIAGFEYERAQQLLGAIPLGAQTAEARTLQDEVHELSTLQQELRHAAHVDRGLMAVAERLLTLTPKDEKVVQLHAKIVKRLARGPADVRFPIISWAAPPNRSALGIPVDWLGGFRRLRGATPDIDKRLAQQPGSFFLAVGLALQGLDRAAIPINLVVAERNGLFGKLFRKKTVAQTAWGLDIGGSSLKAVRLGLTGSPESVVIQACTIIPHRLNLAQPEAEAARSQLIRESLQKWLDQFRPEEDAVLCVNGLGPRTLGRFFQIPTVKSNKISEMVAFEATQQIPFPLEELSWGYQVLESAAATDASDPGGLRPVVLVAQRANDVRDRLHVFQELGLSPQVLQAECLALHNFLMFDCFGDQPADAAALARPANETVALVDVGSDGTNFVVSSRDRVWFRTMRFGGNDVNQALVREFKLTFAQAEEAKLHLDQAPSLCTLLDTMRQIVGKLVGESQRTMGAFSEDQPDRRIDRFWVTGGGAKQFGTLRQFRAG